MGCKDDRHAAYRSPSSANRGAPETGALPKMAPILFHYMMVSLTAMLSEFGPEMRDTSKLAADKPQVETFWRAVEKMAFGKPPSNSEIEALTVRRNAPPRPRS
jgi:hypothetical protein